MTQNLPVTPPLSGRAPVVTALASLLVLVAFSSAAAQSMPPVWLDPASPASYSVHEWTTKNGLPTTTIRGLAETDDGYLWLATSYGLVRFDGTNFTTFDVTQLPPLVSNLVHAIARAPQGGLWLTTAGQAVFRTDGQRVMEQLPRRDTTGEAGGRLAAGPDGTLWATSSSAVHRYGNGAWATFGPREGITGEVLNLAVDRRGTAWVRTMDGVYRQQKTRFVRAASERGVVGRTALVFVDRDDSVWVAGDAGLWVVRESGEAQHVATSPALPGHPTAMAQTASGDLWVGTDTGVYLLQPRRESGAPSWTVVSFPDLDLRGAAVNAMLATSSGALVVATDGAGLRVVVPRPFRLIGAEDALPDMRIHHVADDGQGGVWINSGCALAHVDASLRTVVHDPGDLGLGGCVRSLLRDRAGALWVGQGGGRLTRIPPKGPPRRWDRDAGLPPSDIGPLLEDRDGRLWIGTGLGTLCRMELDGQIRCPALQAPLPPGKVWSLAEGPDGTLWIGKLGTLTRVRGADVLTLARGEGIPAGPVRVLRPEPDGTLWIGTFGGGLARLRHGRTARITTAQGLFDNALSAFVVDRHERAWIMGNRGVFVVARDALEAVADGTRPTFEGVFFGPADDVPEGNGGHPSAFASPTGRLFFATVAGLAVFDGTPPARHEGQRVLLEGASDRGRPLPTDGEAVVGPGGGPVEFQFSAPNIADADNTLIKYQLVGRDREWVLARSRFARYAYLAPGRYQFQLMARDESGAWSAPVTAMRLQVLASWWQAWWVRLLGALLATAAVGGFVQWRIHQMKRANLALAHEIAERKRAEELSKQHLLELAHVGRLATAGELTATLTHELGQPLTAIAAGAEASRVMLAAKADPAEVDATLADITAQSQRASEVVRRLRDFLRRGVTQPTALDLNDEIREVVLLVKSTLDAALVTLSLDLTDDELWVTAERIPLQQVLLNLMVNAAEAMRTSGSPRRLLLVRSTRLPGAARVSVVDSGPGVAASQRAKVFEAFQTTKPEGMGIGLSICKSIVEAHRGRITTRNLPRCGAVFSFTLPSPPQDAAAYNRPS